MTSLYTFFNFNAACTDGLFAIWRASFLFWIVAWLLALDKSLDLAEEADVVTFACDNFVNLRKILKANFFKREYILFLIGAIFTCHLRKLLSSCLSLFLLVLTTFFSSWQMSFFNEKIFLDLFLFKLIINNKTNKKIYDDRINWIKYLLKIFFLIMNYNN